MDDRPKSMFRGILIIWLIVSCCFTAQAEEHCPRYQEGVKNVYWGDLHVHSSYSLDAWGFGTKFTPVDAYRFARGEPLDLPGAGVARLDRPLDFVAITDHAEWFDLMYICTPPTWKNDPYCKTMVEYNSTSEGSKVFAEYVIPTITGPVPRPNALCAADPTGCEKAGNSQWQRVQDHANEANQPCEFTSFVGYEWSATPDFSHSHRNIIFASDNVTAQAIDYMRYPDVEDLWMELQKQCKPEDDCDVIAIPHNTNMGDGVSFDVETQSELALQLRSQYERLVEIHQEKGNSECLAAFGLTDESDCDFEISLTKHSRPQSREDYTQEAWQKMRGTYVRQLLLRGLIAYRRSGEKQRNPLQLGIVASTDNHSATPGFVAEEKWQGSVFGVGSLEKSMSRLNMNPGGLVAVWSEENTRQSLFAALKRREVYGTSGPRIGLKFSGSVGGESLTCQRGNSADTTLTMGSEFSEARHPPQFMVLTQADRVPIVSVEIIKGELHEGELKESVIKVWENSEGDMSVCQTWRDPAFSVDSPAFWYARVQQAPTRRWSTVMCQTQGRCDEFPDAVQSIQEKAWGSPIWYLPD
ncbi:MAG: DUF3604 domain-containing protein [bacterium]|nr:DUF3604 domain-containing protein [Gammaproteobacteria bacterium]